MQKHALLALLASLSLLTGCNANLVGQNDSTLLGSTTPVYTGIIPNPWYLYQDSLHTGGWLKGLDFYDSNPTYPFVDPPVINLSDTTSPYNGQYCMHFGIVAQTGTWWCGMVLIQGSNFAASNASPGVDITPGNFTKCVFEAKTLQGNRSVAFQTLDSTNNATFTITSSWQTYTIPFAVTTDMHAVRAFFSPVFASTAPTTLTPIDLYIDDLRFQQ